MPKGWLRFIGLACIVVPFFRVVSAMTKTFVAVSGGADSVPADSAFSPGLIGIQCVGLALFLVSFLLRSADPSLNAVLRGNENNSSVGSQ